ncbi:MAG: HAMP domain-containing histidine kinase, partial [Lachnospiraceae bacterium]|nr:HAMP domain-containing histidine kinase [Lachnospiraceae bacterium]
ILSRIIGNIISNAMKYSDGDLQITLSERGEMTFSNHASGLDEVQAGKLFDRFYTVHTARKSTGLGLSIAKQLTERMGGIIDAGYREGMLSIYLFFPIISE